MNGPTPNEIRDLRESIGYSRRLFAELIRVSASAVASWETGQRTISPSTWELARIKVRQISEIHG